MFQVAIVTIHAQAIHHTIHKKLQKAACLSFFKLYKNKFH
jgi:hypothetical protein